MKSHVFIFTLIFFIALAHSFSGSTTPYTCGSTLVTGGFTDTFTVQSMDAKLRPLPGALVQVTYDQGVTFAPQYYTTPLQATDSNGLATYTIINQGTNTRTIDCNVVISGVAGWSTAQTTFTALQHSPVIWIVFSDVYIETLVVHDQNGAAIANATVTLANVTKQTDTSGRVEFYAKEGTYNYLVNYKDGEESGTVTVSGDTNTEVVLNRSPIEIQITDDQGNLLPAMLTIANETYNVTNGVYQNPGIFGDDIPYSANYDGIIINGTIDPSVTPETTVVFDLRPPIIGQVTTAIVNDRVRMTMMISDPGASASGVDPSTLTVEYHADQPGAAWATAVAYTTGKDTYSADFPAFTQGSIVDFMIQVDDYAGNKATLSGQFSTTATTSPQNQTTNVNNPPNNSSLNQRLPFSYTVIGLIIIILAVYVVIRTRSKGNGSVQ